MAKYQAKQWTQAESDAWNKEREELLAKIGVDSMSVNVVLGLVHSLYKVCIKKSEKFNNKSDIDIIERLKTNNYESKTAISDGIQKRMEKKNSEKVEQAPEVSRMETAEPVPAYESA